MSSRHAAGRERGLVQAAVRRRGRVDHERLGVADVGEVRAQLAGLDEAPAGLAAALDAEGQDRARPERQVALRGGARTASPGWSG